MCDAFDAMTTARPYRDAIPRLLAFAELRRGAGSRFDRLVVEAFSVTALRTLAPLAEQSIGCSQAGVSMAAADFSSR